MMELDTGLHYPISIEDLPANWVVDNVGVFALEVQSGFACGRHRDDKVGILHVRPMNISKSGNFDLSVSKYVDPNHNSKRLLRGDVLFNNTNSPELIGKTAYVSIESEGLAFSNHMTRVKFGSLINGKYASYQLHFLWMARYYMHKCVKHVNQASISSRDFARTIPFILPPLNEQHRIVDKIEELFSELDAGVESLKKAQTQLQVYRQSLLKHAFEGKLTEQWRKDNADKLETADELLARIKQERKARYRQQLEEWDQAVIEWELTGRNGKKPTKPRRFSEIPPVNSNEKNNLPLVPELWDYQRLGEYIINIEAGKGFKCEEREPQENEIGVAKVSAVSWGVYQESESKTCIDKSKVNSNLFVRETDFIFSRANTIELVGACVIVGETTKSIMLSDKTLRINYEDVNERYILYYLRSRIGRLEIMSRSTGNQDSMRNIGQERIKSICIPICSKFEMDEIGNLIDTYMAFIDKTEILIDVTMKQTNSLRQSILKQSFSGQLVPQDPNDEPASELLKRIQAQKAEIEQQTKQLDLPLEKPKSKKRKNS